MKPKKMDKIVIQIIAIGSLLKLAAYNMKIFPKIHLFLKKFSLFKFFLFFNLCFFFYSNFYYLFTNLLFCYSPHGLKEEKKRNNHWMKRICQRVLKRVWKKKKRSYGDCSHLLFFFVDVDYFEVLQIGVQLDITILRNSHYLANIVTKMNLTVPLFIITNHHMFNINYNRHCHRYIAAS
ncbi:hypothetical protein RFI_37645 [Reticulomyxa filosa]|uniref:Uncharacterized protein n=1 Tax=Reticulomyxa filosa TaxID=46433 RepID=X6LGI0_RETFI|nr:hypothetical protein RFI_37645 [Reticulomyxa filosa]|eukprot:ETN99824.1 hypothetical protein RFI_37645 [Reticulomyxa filosa]